MTLALVVTGITYGLTGLMGCWCLSQWRRRRVHRYLGFSLLASFFLSSLQLMTTWDGVSNVSIQSLWSVGTVGILLVGFGGPRMLERLAILGAVGVLAPLGMTTPDVVVLPLAGLILMAALRDSPYHGSGLETGLAVYYLLPLPFAVLMATAPAGVLWWFVGYRVCHAAGVVMVGRWVAHRPQPITPSLQLVRAA